MYSHTTLNFSRYKVFFPRPDLHMSKNSFRPRASLRPEMASHTCRIHSTLPRLDWIWHETLWDTQKALRDTLRPSRDSETLKRHLETLTGHSQDTCRHSEKLRDTQGSKKKGKCDLALATLFNVLHDGELVDGLDGGQVHGEDPGVDGGQVQPPLNSIYKR